jgi:hypothetical protein
MSSDYRPRGGSSSSSSGGSGGSRRRRGGRGRSGGGGQSGEHRSHGTHANGTSSHSGPKKKVGPIAAFINWITGKKNGGSSSAKPARNNIVTTGARPDFKERTPRAERTDRPERSDRPERPRREERVQADPVPQEIVSPKLYVGNLAYEAAESDLFDLFSKVGAVKNVEIAMDRHANRSKGFGFVEMEALETAKEAAAKLNRTDFMGRQIVVSGAKVDKRPSREEPADNSSPTPNSSEESSI